MGTSVTHRSPATLAWNAVRLGYQFAQVPEQRVLRDVWRAAQTDEAGNWATLLASPVVADGMRIVSSATDARAAVMEFGRLVASSGPASWQRMSLSVPWLGHSRRTIDRRNMPRVSFLRLRTT